MPKQPQSTTSSSAGLSFREEIGTFIGSHAKQANWQTARVRVRAKVRGGNRVGSHSDMQSRQQEQIAAALQRQQRQQ